MRKIIRGAIFALLGGLILSACSGSGAGTSNSGSSKECKIFGEVPAIYAEYESEKDKLQGEEGSNEKIEVLKEEYKAKIEEAGKKLDGQPIEISGSENFNVEKPLTLSFKEFANNLNAMFNVDGRIVTVKEIPFEVTESWLNSHDLEYVYLPVMLAGFDDQGVEVTTARIGTIKGLQVKEGKPVLPSGAAVELQPVSYSVNDYDKYAKVATVRIVIDESTLQ